MDLWYSHLSHMTYGSYMSSYRAVWCSTTENQEQSTSWWSAMNPLRAWQVNWNALSEVLPGVRGWCNCKMWCIWKCCVKVVLMKFNWKLILYSLEQYTSTWFGKCVESAYGLVGTFILWMTCESIYLKCGQPVEGAVCEHFTNYERKIRYIIKLVFGSCLDVCFLHTYLTMTASVV